MVGNILYITLLCVYSVILIVITLKAPQYAPKIKQWFKSRKKQKQQQLEDTIKNIVLGYLKELSNEENKTQSEEWNCSKAIDNSRYIGETRPKNGGH